LPTLVLLDIKGPLIQALGWGLRETDWIVPNREGWKSEASESRQDGRAFQEISATHGDSFLRRMVNSNLQVN
jgi:hypothetical protein